ncbi:hypothetical protein CDAR_72491 [Caerostris darwini]|uniref:Uncharacterized protein n=1 Tax=Caerostris darwini TaxID=1538125 RepID=A0AAV4MKG6_9ARAC|nr:hypothetical protein CDAR_72491 [Caerostris darwini]
MRLRFQRHKLISQRLFPRKHIPLFLTRLSTYIISLLIDIALKSSLQLFVKGEGRRKKRKKTFSNDDAAAQAKRNRLFHWVSNSTKSAIWSHILGRCNSREEEDVRNGGLLLLILSRGRGDALLMTAVSC